MMRAESAIARHQARVPRRGRKGEEDQTGRDMPKVVSQGAARPKVAALRLDAIRWMPGIAELERVMAGEE